MLKKFIYLYLIIVPLALNAFSIRMSKNSVKELYTSMPLNDAGLSEKVFATALTGWEKLNEQGKLRNPEILTIADYSQSSNHKRLYVIDLKNRKLLFNTYVAHGRNTGEEYAQHFSNEPSSLQSSLGFYVTGSTIISPKHGPALTIEGMEKGFNTNARNREIIVHAADYVTEDFIKKHGRLGRSFGCPALPPALNEEIISTIKTGSCLFIYHDNSHYLNSSALIN